VLSGKLCAQAVAGSPLASAPVASPTPVAV